MAAFTHLHVHTQYSLLDGLCKIPDLINRCLETGMNSLAVTDHGNMFGIKEFYDCVDAQNSETKKEIKELEAKLAEESDAAKQDELHQQIEAAKQKIFTPIFGCEAYVARVTPTNPTGTRFVREHKENGSGYHLVLLAKNETGYHNLCKIISSAWIDGYYYRPRIDRELLEKYHEGIIVSSACLAGEIPKALASNNYQKAKDAVLWFKSIFGEDYYLEIQRHKTDIPGADTTVYEQQQVVNECLLKLAAETNTKIIATNDVHFVRKEQGKAHDLLICLSTGKKEQDTDRLHYTQQEWLKSPEEMAEIFADIPEALSNTQEIVAKIEPYKLKHDAIMPMFDIPKEFGTVESYKQKFTEEDLRKEFESGEGNEGRIEKIGGIERAYRIKLEADYLRELTYKGAYQRYGDPIADDIKERIDFELSVMRNMGFPGYFLIVQDFIAAAREMGISVGPGRGSAAGSVVAYCLKITDLDPLKYDLLFERFLNPDRISLPDIDVDFDNEGRYRILDWITEKYGKERVAHIITYGTMATKSSIKDIARVLDLDLNDSNALAKMIPDRFPEDPKTNKAPKVNLKNCIALVPELRQINESDKREDEKKKKVLKYAQQVEGTVRQIGVHACGIIIGADDLTKFAPLATVVDKETDEDIVITQYEGAVIEDVGLIKMDFLGLKTLSIIKETIRNIKKSKGIDLDIDAIPIDDAKTYELFCAGDTVAIFQFESAGMQKYLKELQPSKFEDLIAMNALYRPGPMSYIPQFIKRKHGLEPISYDLPVMEKYLKDTYGITVYQEQVMLLSRLLANFTRGESDALRKAMGKKKKKIVDAMKPKFIEGGIKNGHDPKILEKIWKDWEAFASYAFNKSHAACYSWVAYQTAYLKAHYPAEFMAANLTNELSDIATISLFIEDTQKKNIAVLGPDINESEMFFTVNKDGNIRFGLAALKGVGNGAAESVIKERNENGPFKNIFDFVTRVDLRSCNKRAIESMAYAGVFDCFTDMHRAQFFHADKEGKTFLDKLITYGAKSHESSSTMQTSIFDDVPEMQEMAYPDIPDCDPMTPSEKLKKEKDIAGFYISGHPLDHYKPIIQNYCNVTLADIRNPENHRELSRKTLAFAAMVNSFTYARTKNDKLFSRAEIEDYDGSYVWTFFGTDATKYEHQLHPGELVFVKALMKEQYRGKDYQGPVNYDLKPEEIFFLHEGYEKLCKSVELSFDLTDISTALANELKTIISQSKGQRPLYINIYSTDQKFHTTLSNLRATIDPELFIKNLKLNVPYRLDLK